MQKEIGSTFWLNPDERYNPSAENILLERTEKFGDAVFLSSGRAAQMLALKTIAERNPDLQKCAVIPAYTCSTVVKPFQVAGYEIATYDVDETLHADTQTVAAVIEKTQSNVVLFHRYFGFDTCEDWRDLIDKYQKKGVVFIEDVTQCLFSILPDLHADYIIASIRKWGGMPDGGIALCREGTFSQKPNCIDERMVMLKVKASHLKYQYMMHDMGEKQVFRDMYEQAAELLYAEQQFFKMSPISFGELLNMDRERLRSRRRENYQILFDGLKDQEEVRILTPQIEDRVAPLYFAMLVKNREELQAALREQCIYAPLIWPFEDQGFPVNNVVAMIYKENLCIPVDQRYDIDDMARVVDCIRTFFSH